MNLFSTALILAAILISHLLLRRQLKLNERIETNMAHTLDDAVADIQAEKTIADSLVALTSSLKTQLDAALAGALSSDQQAKVDAIFDGIETDKQELADAVTANTPTAPTAPTAPPAS